MGDFADMALSETMDMEDDRFAYRQGRMRDSQAYELGVIDHLGRYEHRPMFASPVTTPRTMTCRYCNAGGMRWLNTEGRWRLHDNAGIHSCVQYRRGV